MTPKHRMRPISSVQASSVVPVDGLRSERECFVLPTLLLIALVINSIAISCLSFSIPALTVRQRILSATCSTTCSAEFAKCTQYFIELGSSKATAYSRCRVSLDAGTHRWLVQAGCTPSCIDNFQMAALHSTLKTGSYWLRHRLVHVTVPVGASSNASFPVIILLHARGSTGSSMMSTWVSNRELAMRHILVAPEGFQNSWNVVAEPSRENDASFVGSTLLDYCASFSNVKPLFKLLGSSNGAALVNRILIEVDDPRIRAAVTDSSQLNTRQYHNGHFYLGGPQNGYSTIKPRLSPTMVLQITVRGRSCRAVPTPKHPLLRATAACLV